MKRLTLIVALAAFASTAEAQTQQAPGKSAPQSSARAKREGSDCSPQRAGVRCSRPKPKKVWFWGKG